MRSADGKLTTEKCKDAGLALVLLGLICFQFWPRPLIMLLTVIFLLAAMTFPPVFRPFAKFWFALSFLLGAVVSRIILTVLFLVMILPVGLIRRAMGKDAMQIKGWRKGRDSAFRIRDHDFTASDLENPY